ncbi:MAG: AzlC family ABC transporter permease [Peptococcaceae bacterium]|nr:AzlC family ABC transporter permease [Peptococcaceae bacterium]
MSNKNWKASYMTGMRSGLPVILGFVPVGIAYAIMARQAGFSVLETCSMSIAVFAGASQMMAVGMYEQGAGLIAMIVATFILNLRHLIMSTCVMNQMQDGSTAGRLLAAFGVTDESFAIFTTESKENSNLMYFLGLITVTYLSWNAGTLIGAVASDFLPAIVTASLGIALYAMFIGLLFPNLTGNWKLAVLVLLTAMCNTVLTQVMASSWALIISTLLCAFIGVFFVELDEEKEEGNTDGIN